MEETFPGPERNKQFEELLDQLRRRVPPGVAEEEIEADVLAAKRRVRERLREGGC